MKFTSEIIDNLEQLELKFQVIQQKTSKQLNGLLWSKPLTYWDYIQTDTLLSIQTQRTVFQDEMVFIMYHQVNELVFKMILWEMEQLCNTIKPDVVFFKEKILRISRYFKMLTTSFKIMSDGMDIEQYMKFRNTLTPASGFQSAQYRLIEFCATDLNNLIDNRYKKEIDMNESFDFIFDKLYWQAAGIDYVTGKKSFLLLEFEKKYKTTFLYQMEKYSSINIWKKFKELPADDQLNTNLIEEMRDLDKTINITWVMQHLDTAKKYILGSGKGDGEATGGSNWEKYLHPKNQKRIFFPDLWTAEELLHWGE